MQVASESIPWADADNNSTAKRAFKIYNAVGNTDLNASQTFVVNKQPVVDAIGGFAAASHFNRDKTVGDNLSIFGTGFMAVKNLIITDDNDTSQARVSIALPAPGITQTDTAIVIDTATFQMGNGADTILDTGALASSQRIIKLESARDNATSSVAQRFKVGAPPTLASIGGITDGNYSRAVDTMTLTGTGFGHMSLLEIVDVNGNPIAGVPGIFSGADGTGGTGMNIASATGSSIDAGAVGWTTTPHLIDSGVAATRRVKITTPFGSVTSTAATAFRVGAAPTMGATAQATFAGGGFNGGTSTYDKSDGDLIINGTNFRAATSIVWSAGGTVTLDPSNPPAGYTFSADGTKITVAAANVPAPWVGGAGRTVQIFTIDALNVTSQAITTQE